MDLDEIWKARYPPARRMEAAKEPSYQMVKLDECLTMNEMVGPLRQLSDTREPILVKPEEEVRNFRVTSSPNSSPWLFSAVQNTLCTPLKEVVLRGPT